MALVKRQTPLGIIEEEDPSVPDATAQATIDAARVTQVKADDQDHVTRLSDLSDMATKLSGVISDMDTIGGATLLLETSQINALHALASDVRKLAVGSQRLVEMLQRLAPAVREQVRQSRGGTV